MNIVFILPCCGGAGGIRSTVVMANGLLNRGHQVRILYRHNSPAKLRDKLRLIRNRLLYRNQNDWCRQFRGVIEGFTYIVNCKFDPYEIIVATGMECSAELETLSGNSNIKIQYIRGLTPWMPAVMDKALSLRLPKIAISSCDAEKIRSYNSGEVLEVIPNGINVKEYYPSVDEKDRNGIGTVYSSHPAKDPETILRVLTKLKEEMPSVHHYIFGGGRRPKRIPKTDYKRYPSVAEARDRYSRSMVWILGSSSEGLPNPVFEAMACGCAVVATDSGGPRDIITDGENGFLVEVGNVKEIVGKVKLLLDNEGLRQRIAKSAIETVKRFSWDASISKLERVLQKIDSSK